MLNKKLWFGFLITYVLAAGCWWGILLKRKTDELFEIKIKHTDSVIQKNKLIEQLEAQHLMIMGEGLVLLVLFLVGVGIVYRLLRKDLLVQYQQKNFLLSIQHELKSPISLVNLNLGLVLNQEKLNDNQRVKLLKAAYSENKRLANLIDQLLLVSKIEDGFVLEQAVVNLRDFINDYAQRFQEKNGFELNVVADGLDPSFCLSADPWALEIIVNNLLDNAQKFTQHLAPSPLNYGIKVSGNSKGVMQLEVWDLGSGIEKSLRPLVFSRFYKAQSSELTPNHKGTGLGLFICKELCAYMNLKIRLETNTPSGCLFVIEKI